MIRTRRGSGVRDIGWWLYMLGIYWEYLWLWDLGTLCYLYYILYIMIQHTDWWVYLCMHLVIQTFVRSCYECLAVRKCKALYIFWAIALMYHPTVCRSLYYIWLIVKLIIIILDSYIIERYFEHSLRDNHNPQSSQVLTQPHVNTVLRKYTH